MTTGAKIRRHVVGLAVASVLVGSLATCGSGHCDRGFSPEVTFNATVGDVNVDGRATMHVESVVAAFDPGSVPPTEIFGATGPPDTPGAAMNAVTAGSTVVVLFPKEQVDHVRRDIGKRYKVVARPGGDHLLKAELRDMDDPCGETSFAED